MLKFQIPTFMLYCCNKAGAYSSYSHGRKVCLTCGPTEFCLRTHRYSCKNFIDLKSVLSLKSLFSLAVFYLGKKCFCTDRN